MPTKQSDQAGSSGHERDLILAARLQAMDISSQTARDDSNATFEQPANLLSAASFPGYELERELHRGGQGVVYLATQQATQRKVAIKVTREGPFGSLGDRARFDREVRVLAQLKHPNIVTIHDSSESGGHHYFVMDYVRGRPPDKYVAEHDLSVLDTLQLFARVCRAVNAAHMRGVIHRDLKPGNILIDEHGEPRVLDFGLAKLDQPGAEQESELAAVTQTGQFIGTMPWASPEQALGAHDRIDVRTDVYALGVMLYQVLTRHFPYRVVGNVRDVVTQITEVPPARPSRFRQEIDDDVETIVLKCLAKEPDRRYQSAAAVADDIDRYLSNEPILARPPSAAYHFRKLVSRHRLSSALVMALIACVLGFAVWMTFLYRTADNLREEAQASAAAARTSAGKANQVSQFLIGLFEQPPGQYLDETVTARQLLDIGRQRLGDSLQDQPDVRAAVLLTVGGAYAQLGLFDDAADLMQQALDIRRRILEPTDDELLVTLESLARLRNAQANRKAAAVLYQELVDVRRQKYGDRHPDLAATLARLGEQLYGMGRIEEADAAYTASLEVYANLDDPSAANTDEALQLQGDMHRMLSQLREAEEFYRRSLALYENGEQGLSTDDMNYAARWLGLAYVLIDAKEHAEAVAAASKAIDLLLTVHKLGEDHPTVGVCTRLIAETQFEAGELADAEGSASRVVEINTAQFGLVDIDSIRALSLLGDIQSARRDFEHAEGNYRTALTSLEKLDDPPAYLQGSLRSRLAGALKEGGHLEEAEQLAREAVEINRGEFGSQHHVTAQSLRTLADLQTARGEYAAAEEGYREALGIFRGLDTKLLKEQDVAVAKVLTRLAFALDATGRVEEAEALYREALGIFREAPDAELVERVSVRARLAKRLMIKREFGEAAELHREVLSLLDDAPMDVESKRISHMLSLSRCLRQLGQLDEALTVGEQAEQASADVHGSEHWLTAEQLGNVGAVLLAMGRVEEAEEQARLALEVFGQTTAPPLPVAAAQGTLGECLTVSSDYEEAESLLLSSLETLKAERGLAHDETRAAVRRIAKLYDAWGREDLAEQHRSSLSTDYD